jgi:hypothetical protein
MGHPLIERRRCWGRAYRDGMLVCGRVEVTVRADARFGLAPRERRCVTVRFRERVDPVLRKELSDLVRRRGVAARRAAERMKPIEIVFDDPGLPRIVGWVEPPQRRHGALHEIEFGLCEPAP